MTRARTLGRRHDEGPRQAMRADLSPSPRVGDRQRPCNSSPTPTGFGHGWSVGQPARILSRTGSTARRNRTSAAGLSRRTDPATAPARYRHVGPPGPGRGRPHAHRRRVGPVRAPPSRSTTSSEQRALGEHQVRQLHGRARHRQSHPVDRPRSASNELLPFWIWIRTRSELWPRVGRELFGGIAVRVKEPTIYSKEPPKVTH